MDDRPTTSDQLPSGRWLQDIRDSGYAAVTLPRYPGLVPIALAVVVIAVSHLLTMLWWDPDTMASSGTQVQLDDLTRATTSMFWLVLIGWGVLLAFNTWGVTSPPPPRSVPDADLPEYDQGLGTLIIERAGFTLSVRMVGCLFLSYALIFAAWNLPQILVGGSLLSTTVPLGIALLLVIPWALLLGRGLRPMVQRELDALDVPMGPKTLLQIRAWRFLLVSKVPDGQIFESPTGVGAMNGTLNIANPVGRAIVIFMVTMNVVLAVVAFMWPVFG